jgi:hypothetical protein
MAYADLTTEQKKQIDDFMALARPWCGELARVHNHGQTVFTAYWGIVAPIMDLLQDGDEIPNATGLSAAPITTDTENLSGATVVTKAELGTILAWQSTVAALNNESNRQLMARAAGAINIQG